MTPSARQPDVISLNIKEYAAIRLFVDVPTVRNKQDALEALRSAEYRQGATHTSAPAPYCLCVECSYSARSAKSCRHTLAGEDKRKIAKAAREQENKRLVEEVLGFIAGWGSLNYQIPKRYLKDFVESLRQPEPQQ